LPGSTREKEVTGLAALFAKDDDFGKPSSAVTDVAALRSGAHEEAPSRCAPPLEDDGFIVPGNHHHETL